MVGYFGLDGRSKGLTSNGRADVVGEVMDEELLPQEEASAFRALAARINFLAQDCPDIQFPAKEVCQDMAVPTRNSWAKMKRLARYLVLRKKVVFQYHWQDEGCPMTLFADRVQEDAEIDKWGGDYDRGSLHQGVEPHTRPDCLEQCGSRVLRDGRRSRESKGSTGNGEGNWLDRHGLANCTQH